jgi:DNA ligase-1
MQTLELHRYFQYAPESDKLWAIAILSGKKVHSGVSLNLLREFGLELSGLDEWLFDECYSRVNDLAETIALILPPPQLEKELSLTAVFDIICESESAPVEEKRRAVLQVWNSMETFERFIFNKLLTTGLRLRLPRRVIAESIGRHTGMDHRIISFRLSGAWIPRLTSYTELVLSAHPDEMLALPYPFSRVQKTKTDPDLLGSITDWIAEWKWEGIRVQVIKRSGHVFIWNRDEELITDKLPELDACLRSWPEDTVMDGQLIAFRDGSPLPLSLLQQRMARKNIDRKTMGEVPVVFIAFDLMEHNGMDIRNETLSLRRKFLSALFKKYKGDSLMLSEDLSYSTWTQFKEAGRSRAVPGTDGLILKGKNSIYASLTEEAWLSWRPEQLSLDAVLIYAEAGPRSNVAKYSHYTFALWNGDLLVPVAKSGIGLTGAEVQAIDDYVRSNTKEKFGPVRSVAAELVFEIGFESVSRSTRHKSGVLLRMPRILRWRTDKKAAEAHTLQDLIALIPV